MATLDIVTHPGTEKWALKAADSERIARWLRHDVRLEYWPRARVAEAWHRDKSSDTPARTAEIEAAGLPFRGYSFATGDRGCVACIFVDRLETYESATFVVLHELAHLHLPPWSPDEATDEEEDRADLVAAHLMHTLLGYEHGVREVSGRASNPRIRCCPGGRR